MPHPAPPRIQPCTRPNSTPWLLSVASPSPAPPRAPPRPTATLPQDSPIPAALRQPSRAPSSAPLPPLTLPPSLLLAVEGLAAQVDLSGQSVLMRVDLNVPLDKEDPMKVTDDTRLRAIVPSAKFLLDKGAKLILMSQCVRPPPRPLLPQPPLTSPPRQPPASAAPRARSSRPARTAASPPSCPASPSCSARRSPRRTTAWDPPWSPWPRPRPPARCCCSRCVPCRQIGSAERSRGS